MKTMTDFVVFANIKSQKTVGVAKSTQKLNPAVPKGKGKYIMKLINGMEPERYLASLLLANSSYKGEKYYKKEDEYTEIIKENKHLLLDNNDNGPIDKKDDAILYEHEFPIILKCEKCGRSEKSSVYFSNHIPTAKASFKYEYGTKKDQKGKYWWTCDCGGSMYVTKKFIK